MSNEHPNILIFLSDQLRRQAHGCYGDPNVLTPHVDQLAAEGVRFANACSTYPICVPFRFTLMTGHYAHSRCIPGIHYRMSPAERTLADEFNDAGYKTIYVGKWHLDGNSGDPVPVERQGRWQRWIGHEHQTGLPGGAGGPAHLHRDIELFDSKTQQSKRIKGYTTDALVDLTMETIREERREGQPFCCVCSVLPPHPPLDPPEEEMERWKDRGFEAPPNLQYSHAEYPEVRGDFIREFDADDIDWHWRSYYAMVENLDKNVGRLRAFLEDEGLDDNTIVLYVSDHGELAGCHGLRGKQFPFEESVGIPLIVYDPRRRQDAGRVVEEPVATEDIFPTILGLCGLPARDELHGADCTPLMRGEIEALDRPGALLEFVRDDRPQHAFFNQGWRAVRTRDSVYMNIDGKPWMFFDLENDPYQTRNLVDDPDSRERIAQHHQWLAELLEKTGDHYRLDDLT
ncbi:MAG: sulfatase-like hydrolase/transferase [Candidatus Sumerlaeota bacterium]